MENKYINALHRYFNERYKTNDDVWCSKSVYKNAYEFPPTYSVLKLYTEQFLSVTWNELVQEHTTFQEILWNILNILVWIFFT